MHGRVPRSLDSEVLRLWVLSLRSGRSAFGRGRLGDVAESHTSENDLSGLLSLFVGQTCNGRMLERAALPRARMLRLAMQESARQWGHDSRRLRPEQRRGRTW